VAGQPGHERVDRSRRERGGARVVRVAHDHDPGGGGDLARHRLEVVLAGVVKRDGQRAGAGHRGKVRVDRERGPGVYQLRPGFEHRLGGGEEQLARPVADRDPASRHASPLGQAAAQDGAFRVGVAVERAQVRLDRLEHLGVRREGRLVRGELHELAVEGVGGRRGVDRDIPQARVELEPGHWAP
jgi:hypothetical protein